MSGLSFSASSSSDAAPLGLLQEDSSSDIISLDKLRFASVSFKDSIVASQFADLVEHAHEDLGIGTGYSAHGP